MVYTVELNLNELHELIRFTQEKQWESARKEDYNSAEGYRMRVNELLDIENKGG